MLKYLKTITIVVVECDKYYVIIGRPQLSIDSLSVNRLAMEKELL